MKTKGKEHLQCGYEDRCKNKDCLNCPRKRKMELNLTHAEISCIEDFAICDLESMLTYNKKQIELMQNIMTKLMKKVLK